MNISIRQNDSTQAKLTVAYQLQRLGQWIQTHLWPEVQRSVILTIGSVLSAFGYTLFQIPHDLAAGGISGIGILINHYTGWSAGLLFLCLNIPIVILGFFFLGRWRFLIYTMTSIFIFSIGTDWLIYTLPYYLDQMPITEDILLSSIYAGVVGGIGGGMVYRSGATMGGTGVIGRILQQRTGLPLSQMYLYTDGIIIVAAGFVFGWEIALYAVLVLLLSGLASDYVLEGPSRARTAMIITTKPQEMVQKIDINLQRGSSHWETLGGHTGEKRTVIMCTVYRPQVNALKHLVQDIDPQAFVSIGVTQQAIGNGFN